MVTLGLGGFIDDRICIGAYVFLLLGAAISWIVKLSQTACWSSQDTAHSEKLPRRLSIFENWLVQQLGFGRNILTTIFCKNKGAIMMGLHQFKKPATRQIVTRKHWACKLFWSVCEHLRYKAVPIYSRQFLWTADGDMLSNASPFLNSIVVSRKILFFRIFFENGIVVSRKKEIIQVLVVSCPRLVGSRSSWIRLQDQLKGVFMTFHSRCIRCI